MKTPDPPTVTKTANIRPAGMALRGPDGRLAQVVKHDRDEVKHRQIVEPDEHHGREPARGGIRQRGEQGAAFLHAKPVARQEKNAQRSDEQEKHHVDFDADDFAEKKDGNGKGGQGAVRRMQHRRVAAADEGAPERKLAELLNARDEVGAKKENGKPVGVAVRVRAPVRIRIEEHRRANDQRGQK
ncbi:MAG: hypothetical protein M5R36_09180 [Deltaproteobacteria bacterium]|nr:hypothetical protein [Deltaproteobacteria bacterium]